VESNTTEIQTFPEMHHIPNKDFTPSTTNKKKEIYKKKGSHLYLPVQITKKHRKLKRLLLKCHCHHGESTRTLTIQKTPHPQKHHHQVSAADLPAHTQSNFAIMLNTQYVKYHI